MNKLIILSAICLWLSGCNTMPSTPLPQEFIYPAQLTAMPAELTATIQGSEQNSSGWGMDKQRVFIKRIDGKLTQADRTSWNQAWPITAGNHVLDVEFGMGVHVIPATLMFDAKPRQSYQLQFKSNFGTWISGNSQSDFWIINAQTGETVSNIVHGLRSNSVATPIFVPVIKSK